MEDRDLTEQEQVRRSKLEKYAELGVNPFGQKFERTHSSVQVKNEYSNKTEEELAKKDKVISDRKILLKESGSIAEASLRLNDIFKIAQDSADDYLKSIEAMKIKEEKLLQKLEKEKAKLTKSKSKKEKK